MHSEKFKLDFRTKMLMSLCLSYTLILGNIQTKFSIVAAAYSLLPYVFLLLNREKKAAVKTEFVGVLATRDSAIIHFTEELHGVSNQARTSLIRCVLQYINLKIYDNIKVTELAKQFYLSESALRSRFKEEIGVPINEYVNKRKIEESKMMIWSGIPAGEIARRLSFYDLSHYYRTFKKYTGVTPQQFRDTNIIGQEM